MGVGLSSKHWALRSHSFSAEQARRADESARLSATTERRSPATKRESRSFAQTLEEEKLVDLKPKRVCVTYISLFLRDFCDWVVLP